MWCLAALVVFALLMDPSLALPLSKHAHAARTNTTKVGGVYGVDVSTLVSQSAFECMKGSGIDFVIVRGYQSIGELDSCTRTLRAIGFFGGNLQRVE